MKNKYIYLIVVILLLASGVFFVSRNFNTGGPKNSAISTEQASRQNKDYYVSFDDYYYEIPKQKAADDKVVVGAQFVYSLNTSIKTNTLDDLFDSGAIGVQALIALNGENQPFESYLNTVVKPAAESAFSGSTAELSLGTRKSDGVRTGDLLSKKGNKVIRRQHIVNLPQSIAIVSKDDSETFLSIGRTIAQASVKFSDYQDIKLLILAESQMLKNYMFTDIYNLAHPDLRNATSAEEVTKIADRSKDMFKLETKVSGFKLSKDEMSAGVLFTDTANPSKNKAVNMFFRLSEGKWKLFSLNLPNGSVTGTTQERKN